MEGGRAGGELRKHFAGPPADARDAARREWRALRLLAERAPGLAPHPLAADLRGDRPWVAMTRLPGVPLRGLPLTPEVVQALTRALARLHFPADAPAAEALPLRPGHPAAVAARVREWAPRLRPHTNATPHIRRALDAGLDWLGAHVPIEAHADAEARAVRVPDPASAPPPVFGPGDGNLANYLYDQETSTVHVVDFEESGRSDRAFELAELTEHVSAWSEAAVELTPELLRLPLGPAERSLLPGYRRLLALVWLLLLTSDGLTAHPRNPPGTTDRQADRLLSLLSPL